MFAGLRLYIYVRPSCTRRRVSRRYDVADEAQSIAVCWKWRQEMSRVNSSTSVKVKAASFTEFLARRSYAWAWRLGSRCSLEMAMWQIVGNKSLWRTRDWDWKGWNSLDAVTCGDFHDTINVAYALIFWWKKFAGVQWKTRTAETCLCAVLRDIESMAQGTSLSCECLDITRSIVIFGSHGHVLSTFASNSPISFSVIFSVFFRRIMTLRQFWKSLGAEQMSAWFAANKTCSDEPRRSCSCFCSKLVQFKSMNNEQIYEISLNFRKHIGTQSGWVRVGVLCAGASEGSSAGAGQSQATDVVGRLWLTVKYDIFSLSFCICCVCHTWQHSEMWRTFISTCLSLSFHHFDRKARRQPLLTHPERAVRRRKTLGDIPCQLSVTRCVVTWCVYDLWSQHKPCRR